MGALLGLVIPGWAKYVAIALIALFVFGWIGELKLRVHIAEARVTAITAERDAALITAKSNADQLVAVTSDATEYARRASAAQAALAKSPRQTVIHDLKVITNGSISPMGSCGPATGAVLDRLRHQ